MAIPKVVIVGRPNVGKSSLFNWLAGRRIAIVDPTSGVTRDRIEALVDHNDRYFELVDTGGMGVVDADGLTADIERQIDFALGESSVILFVVDAQTGLLPLDDVVAKRLRYCEVPILCVANKCDNEAFTQHARSEFYKLGRKLLCVSAAGRVGRHDLLDAVLEKLPPDANYDSPNVQMKFAVVGKRNAGKSTFINQLAHADRMIVSEVPGTTRESVDVRFEMGGKTYIAIDTAGVRRQRSLVDSIEYYGYARAEQTIRRADVVMLFLDATSRISKVDKKLAYFIMEQHKPCIVVVNKWDLMAQVPTSRFDYYVDASFPGLNYAPRAFITAKTGKNVHRLVELAYGLYQQSCERVPTPVLNRVLQEAVSHKPPPIRQNKRPKLFFGTQVSACPPTLVLFSNYPKLIEPSYERYLLNHFRQALPFQEVPIKLYFRQRDSHGGDRSGAGTDAEKDADAEDLPNAAPVVANQTANSASTRILPKRARQIMLADWDRNSGNNTLDTVVPRYAGETATAKTARTAANRTEKVAAKPTAAATATKSVKPKSSQIPTAPRQQQPLPLPTNTIAKESASLDEDEVLDLLDLD